MAFWTPTWLTDTPAAFIVSAIARNRDILRRTRRIQLSSSMTRGAIISWPVARPCSCGRPLIGEPQVLSGGGDECRRGRGMNWAGWRRPHADLHVQEATDHGRVGHHARRATRAYQQ